MADYFPETVPDEDLQIYLQRELEKIAASLNVKDVIIFEILNVAPVRIQDGMLIYADGTNFNPGSGEGFYGRENGIWVKL